MTDWTPSTNPSQWAWCCVAQGTEGTQQEDGVSNRLGWAVLPFLAPNSHSLVVYVCTCLCGRGGLSGGALMQSFPQWHWSQGLATTLLWPSYMDSRPHAGSSDLQVLLLAPAWLHHRNVPPACWVCGPSLSRHSGHFTIWQAVTTAPLWSSNCGLGKGPLSKFVFQVLSLSPGVSSEFSSQLYN